MLGKNGPPIANTPNCDSGDLHMALFSCDRPNSANTIDRLEICGLIEAQFNHEIGAAYTVPEKTPELRAALSPDGYSFVLTATNKA